MFYVFVLCDFVSYMLNFCHYSKICLLRAQSRDLNWCKIVYIDLIFGLLYTVDMFCSKTLLCTVDMFCSNTLSYILVCVQSEKVELNINLCKCKGYYKSNSVKVKII